MATSVDLSWDVVSGATEYHIYRDGVEVGISTETTFTDSGLTASTTYTYEVIAVIVTEFNTVVESDKSISVEVTTIA